LNNKFFRRNWVYPVEFAEGDNSTGANNSQRGDNIFCVYFCGFADFLYKKNMLTRTQKEELVKNLSDSIKDGKVVIFSDYAGTTVAKMKDLREALREQGSTYKITKKKLIDRSLKEAGIKASVLALEGQIGIAIGKEDEVSAAKVLAKFAKENKNFKILQGVLESKVISGEDVLSLAALPGREELLAKMVGSINAPVSGFVNALAGNLRNLVGVLKAISEKG
jgi:large subunit ribosomal protein L10